MEIENRNIIITGASEGLGKQTAIRLARKGGNLILVARAEKKLKQVQQEIKSLTGEKPLIAAADISLEHDVQALVKKVGKHFPCIDVLINNAGIGIYRNTENLSNEDMRRHFEVNFFGVFYCIKMFLPMLKKSRSGYILNIGSVFCRIAMADNSVYAASKFALDGFTQGLRQELKSYNIKAGIFMPGAMNTSFQKKRSKNSINAPEFMVLDLEKAATKIEGMIIKKKKSLMVPAWFLTALKIKQKIC